ncbi:MAG TPA: ATP-binding protein [Patescibacteria group bacterium]|nr:ATP-binding protein [Patescibacteria group bacterium]
MNYISRFIEKSIKERLFKGKLIILYGARQVGKTTLVKNVLKEYPEEQGKYLNCELLSVQRALAVPEAETLKAFLGHFNLIVLDEAQHIENIGIILKILIDTYPETQIIATGSSSFDLAQKVNEPLTGRTCTFTLFPLSLQEIKQHEDLIQIEAKLENLLRFGSYPEIFSLDEQGAKERLNEIASNYIYKDVLNFDGLKKSSVIKNLLQLLALQLGQEVSYNELAVQLGIDRLTVIKYIDILEQSFVVFTLRAFSRNLRKEISKSVKVYFVDLGIRNSIIENYNRLLIRNDVGALWENFCIIERMKNNQNHFRFVNSYFWRTYDQKEIDYIEESEGTITGFEFKWNDKKTIKQQKEFSETYYAQVQKVDRTNYWQFLELQ